MRSFAAKAQVSWSLALAPSPVEGETGFKADRLVLAGIVAGMVLVPLEMQTRQQAGRTNGIRLAPRRALPKVGSGLRPFSTSG